MDQKSAIIIQNVDKHFGTIHAVDKFSLTVGKGNIFALVGPNGAGKTTLVKMMVGLDIPDAGDIYIEGINIGKNPVSAKSKFGYVSDNPESYPYLTAKEFMSLCGKLRGMSPDKIDSRIKYLSSIFPIKDIIDSPMGDYSRGNRQKIGLLSAIISEPEVLIIDEPIVGLDPESIEILGNLFKDYANSGKSVFFITHILKFAHDYASLIGVMNKGKLTKTHEISKGLNIDKLL